MKTIKNKLSRYIENTYSEKSDKLFNRIANIYRYIKPTTKLELKDIKMICLSDENNLESRTIKAIYNLILSENLLLKDIKTVIEEK